MEGFAPGLRVRLRQASSREVKGWEWAGRSFYHNFRIKKLKELYLREIEKDFQSSPEDQTTLTDGWATRLMHMMVYPYAAEKEMKKQGTEEDGTGDKETGHGDLETGQIEEIEYRDFQQPYENFRNRMRTSVLKDMSKQLQPIAETVWKVFSDSTDEERKMGL